jgi:integrase/recombinase XerD
MANEIVPLDFRQKAKTEMAGLVRDNSICSANKRLIQEFIRDCYAEGLSHARVAKYTNLLKQLARRLQKPFRKVTIDDIKALLEEVELADYSAWTKRDYRIGLKRFWRWLAGTEQYPEIVSWIKTTLSERSRKHPSDMLNESEIQRLIECANHPRDRALVAVFWETGCRVGELLTMRISSFKDAGEICYLDVLGKTGPRRIPIVASVPDLTRWLSFHPTKGDPSSPMWVRLNRRREPEVLSYPAFCEILRCLVRKAGTKKRVHPHLFRHSRATFLASRLTEAQMKHFFGWTQGSKMAATYVHLSGRDIQESILELYGKGSGGKANGPEITVTRCARCGHENGSTSRFCARCGASSSPAETVSVFQKVQFYEELLNTLLSETGVTKTLERQLGHNKDLVSKLKQFVKNS